MFHSLSLSIISRFQGWRRNLTLRIMLMKVDSYWQKKKKKTTGNGNTYSCTNVCTTFVSHNLWRRRNNLFRHHCALRWCLWKASVEEHKKKKTWRNFLLTWRPDCQQVERCCCCVSARPTDVSNSRELKLNWDELCCDKVFFLYLRHVLTWTRILLPARYEENWI